MPDDDDNQEPPTIKLDAEMLKRLTALAHTSGQQLFERIKRDLAQGQTEAAVTLFILALFANVGTTLARFTDPMAIPPQVNALWRIMQVPVRIDFDTVQ